jgi:hypothetical protein
MSVEAVPGPARTNASTPSDVWPARAATVDADCLVVAASVTCPRTRCAVSVRAPPALRAVFGELDQPKIGAPKASSAVVPTDSKSELGMSPADADSLARYAM